MCTGTHMHAACLSQPPPQAWAEQPATGTRPLKVTRLFPGLDSCQWQREACIQGGVSTRASECWGRGAPVLSSTGPLLSILRPAGVILAPPLLSVTPHHHLGQELGGSREISGVEGGA